MDRKSRSIIIPAYNEEKNIGDLLSSLSDMRTNGILDEIIVINDGSTDQTGAILSSIPEIELITNEQNRGKANAIAKGVHIAKGEILVLLDADLLNFKAHHLQSMTRPLERETHRIVIARIESYTLAKFTSPVISGQRAYLKEDLLPHIDSFKKLGYGIETWLTKNLGHLPSKQIKLRGVRYLNKYQKHGIRKALIEHIRMWPEVARPLLQRPQTYDTNWELKPKRSVIPEKKATKRLSS